MAYELHGMLTGAVSVTTWEKVMPAYGGGPESFLNNVVTPIYRVIKEVVFLLQSSFFFFFFSSCLVANFILLKKLKEAEKSKNGTTDHSTWRNYDDLNEYFWLELNFQSYICLPVYFPISNTKLVFW